MKTIIEENYKSIVNRGLINKKTTKQDFINKLYEEVNEVEESITLKELSFELADVILTALNYAKHYKIDIETIIKQKIEINKNR